MNLRPRMDAVSLTIALLALPSSSAFAKQLQIIHTNDLHSFFERGDDAGSGGYAAVKGVMDRLKAQANQQGIETLTLDAGDFSEGTPFFIANHGEDSWKMIQSMGYDAIAIGNHDWFVGPAAMDKIVSDIHPTVPFLSANLHINSRYPAINQAIQAHALFTRSGMKIAVVGLATDELIYKWMDTNGNISSPEKAMKDELKKLRASNDLVIALTHIGVDADQKLAKNLNGVDVIVGGHSHTALPEPILVKNPRGIEVPIVQTGAHGQFVGDLLIDYEPGLPVKVIHYHLVPVVRDSEIDPEIQHQVVEARHDLENVYTPEWLYHEVGKTNTPMELPITHPTAWGNFYTDAMREAAHTDMALDETQFYGIAQPAGSINRENILSFYPHYFNLDRPSGWSVWTIHAPGWELALILDIVVKSGTFFNLSNCEYDVKVDRNGKPSMHNLRIGGRKVAIFKDYTVAVSEGIGLGAQDMLGGITRFLTRPHDSTIPVWTAVEEKIARTSPEELLSLNIKPAHHLPSNVRWRPASLRHLGEPTDIAPLLDR